MHTTGMRMENKAHFGLSSSMGSYNKVMFSAKDVTTIIVPPVGQFRA